MNRRISCTVLGAVDIGKVQAFIRITYNYKNIQTK